jgi:hypothetical protein
MLSREGGQIVKSAVDNLKVKSRTVHSSPMWIVAEVAGQEIYHSDAGKSVEVCRKDVVKFFSELQTIATRSPVPKSGSARGKFQIKRKSQRDRMRAKLQAIKQEPRRRTHQPIPVQGKWLNRVVTGYLNYHAVPTNSRALAAFRFFVTELWQQTLRRRSQKSGMTWERITRLANDWLPQPRILHPWPQARFAVTHPRWEPYAGIPLVRICAGGAPK